MCLYGFQLFQAPFQLIQRLHGQPLSTLICHAHQRSFIRTIITCYFDKMCMSLLCRLRPTRIIHLTISPPIPLSLYTLPYWSNRPFFIFDIRALWRSVLSARAPECQKLTRGPAIAEEPRNALHTSVEILWPFLTELLTTSSANPEEPCEHTVS